MVRFSPRSRLCRVNDLEATGSKVFTVNSAAGLLNILWRRGLMFPVARIFSHC